MARPRKPAPSRRYHVTLEAAEAAAMESYARQLGRPPASVLAQLAREARERAEAGGQGDELAEARRRVGQLQSEVNGLREQLHQREQGRWSDVPRYAWPIEELLDDREWWQRYLPRLYAMLGRQFPADRTGHAPTILDQRGYVDLLTLLFPAIEVTHPQTQERRRVLWHNSHYPEWSWRDQAEQSRTGGRAKWEETLRLVAEALCAIEYTEQPDIDPYLRMRLRDEVRGPWLAELRLTCGLSTNELLPTNAVAGHVDQGAVAKF